MSPRTLKQSVKLGIPHRAESYALAVRLFESLAIEEDRVLVTPDSPIEMFKDLPISAKLELALRGKIEGFELRIRADMDDLLPIFEGTHLEDHPGCIKAVLDYLSEAIKTEQGQCDPVFLIADYIHGHAVASYDKKETPEPAGDMVTSSNDKTIH